MAEEKVCEKPCLPVSIQEDCTERWLVVRAKALCNLDVFPPCMIIQIMGLLAEAFPKVFFCGSCVIGSSSLLYVFCLILLNSIKLPQV